MKNCVENAVNDLRRSFPKVEVKVEEDGSGGAYVIVEAVDLGPKYLPQQTWIGGHIPPQFPYADIYPLFINADVSRTDETPFSAPITTGHIFCTRAALQVSRRTNRLDPAVQTAAIKFHKVLRWLQEMA